MFRWLTTYGFLTAILLASVSIFFLGWQSVILPMFFLVAGSLLSKLNKSPEDSRPRNTKQVLANGGLVLLVAPLSSIIGSDASAFLFSLIFGVAMADTSSSEIGRYMKWKTVDICNFKTIAVGLSGGISIPGIVAAAVFSLSFGALAFAIFPAISYLFWHLVVYSFCGMLIDSLLGSLFQAKYMIDGMIKEHGLRRELFKGIHGVTNDVVNVISIFITLLLAYGMCIVYKIGFY